jgi:penicillin-binding protein 1A
MAFGNMWPPVLIFSPSFFLFVTYGSLRQIKRMDRIWEQIKAIARSLLLSSIESSLKLRVRDGKTAQDRNPDPGVIPQEGQTLEGVVIAVDDGQGSVTVRMGKAIGMIYIGDMRWARRPDPAVAFYETRLNHPSGAVKVGDVILVRIKMKKTDPEPWELTLEQIPKVQSALLSLETETGHVKAMVGGSDFKRSQFNRAIQSRRQPGSAFKPLIYAAALDKGYTPATILIDSPIVYKDVTRNFKWKPKNYDKKFQGPTLLRNALAHSRNLIAIKLLKDIGIDYAIDYAQKLGVTSPLNRNLSIALGSSGISLLERVKAYSVFANAGHRIEPVFIVKILDKDGNVLEEAVPARKKIIQESTAYIITSLLEGVVQQGTGQRVRALNRPVAGKTGTTNNLYDAWFVGYTPRYTTGTWVGFDEEVGLGKGETGSRAASPIWLGFMKRMLADRPIQSFQVPEDVIFAKIDAKTGLLPILESKKELYRLNKPKIRMRSPARKRFTSKQSNAENLQPKCPSSFLVFS